MIPQHQWTVIGMGDIGEVVSRENDFINGKEWILPTLGFQALGLFFLKTHAKGQGLWLAIYWLDSLSFPRDCYTVLT